METVPVAPASAINTVTFAPGIPPGNVVVNLLGFAEFVVAWPSLGVLLGFFGRD